MKGSVCIHGKRHYLRAHRVAYLLQTGEWPDQIDHIDGHRSNNKWVNLRNTSKTGNDRNLRRFRNNTSGTGGVCWHKRYSAWIASIKVNRRTLHLGYFTNKDDAITTRKAAELLHGFHPNHGAANRPHYERIGK